MEIKQEDGIIVIKIKQFFNKIELLCLLKKHKKNLMKIYTDIGYYTYLYQNGKDNRSIIEEKLTECERIMKDIQVIKHEMNLDHPDYFQDK